MDESVHGAFSSYIFRKELAKLDAEKQEYIISYIEEFSSTLYSKVDALLNFVYTEKHIIEDIKRFANYNFNRTLKSLGLAEVFEGDDIDFNATLKSEITAGLDVTHDIFSMVGNVYFMMEHKELTKANFKSIDQELKTRSSLLPKPIH